MNKSILTQIAGFITLATRAATMQAKTPNYTTSFRPIGFTGPNPQNCFRITYSATPNTEIETSSS
jgi:hypothetical protein